MNLQTMEKGTDNTFVSESEKKKPNKKVVFDTFTIRTWFMAADKDNKGFISKREFLNFLIEHPDLMKMLVSDLGEIEGERNLEWHVKRSAETEVQRQARVQRRLLGFYRTIDVDKNKCLDFDEFLALFQKAGCVLQYETAINPRELAEAELASVQGTGPLQDLHANVVRRARRGSEDVWARGQKFELEKNFDKLPAAPARPRRHSTHGGLGAIGLGLHNSPASFWGETLVLGQGPNLRRRSCTGRTSDITSASVPNF